MGSNNNLDDFWNLKELIPQKKAPKMPPRKSVSAVEVVVSELQQASSTDNTLGPQVLSQGKKSEVLPTSEYENPTPLIKNVKIYNWRSEYNYYDLFCRHAEYYRKMQAHECEHVHFFSYMPQYSQMNQKQIDWYLWWRDRVNNKAYLDTDHTYIILYVFELINLSNKETAEDALDIMINLWAHYHETYPQLDKTLGEWICDFALIYQIPISFPDKRLSREMINDVTIPEVFYSFDFSDTQLLAKFLVSYCNSYNYRKSKFYNGNTSSLYEKHILASLEAVLSESNLSTRIFTETVKQTSKIAFMGALCSFKAKKRIEITYASIALEGELRAYISDIIKYAENKVRSVSGVRSRLGVKHIDDTVKSIIDRYFIFVFGKNTESIIVPDYERLYDVKSEPFSVELAKKIEIQSWDVTQKLVEAFEEEAENASETPPAVTPTVSDIIQTQPNYNEENNSSVFYKAISQYSAFFELIKEGKYSEQIAYIKSNKLISEAVVDEINEAAAEIFGDILLEEADVGYKIIDDYKDIFTK